MSTAVVLAYHDVGCRALKVLLEHKVTISLIVTHRDDPRENIWFGSVAEIARQNRIPVIYAEDIDENHLVDRLKELRPEFLFSFYYRKMLGKPVLDVPAKGAFNMHGSLLPKYRGRVPVNWAIIKGETETGATLHEMTVKPDAGRIVGQKSVPIGPDDTALEVFRRVTDAAESVMKQYLPSLLNGTAKLIPQDLSKGSYFSGRKPEDGRIDWSRSATEIHNLVRAVAPPYPGAFTEYKGSLFKIYRTKKEGSADPAKSIGIHEEGGNYYAVCGDRKILSILEHS